MSDRDHRTKPLVLPQGITQEQLLRAVAESGYPLQTVAALQLKAHFTVTEEWGYVDRVSDERRSLDLFADKNLTTKTLRLEPFLVLMIECKRSDLPYVFFAAAIPRVPTDFPTIVGFHRTRFELHREGVFTEVSPAEFLRCSELKFSSHPTVVSAFSRVERKNKKLEVSGTVPYNSVVLPLASALDHYRRTWSVLQEQKCYYPSIAVCLSILDAPMIVARGTPEEPHLANEPWVRIVRQEAIYEGNHWRRRDYVVDVVHRQFLTTYVSDYLLPMGEEVATRMKDREDLIIAGKGLVARSDWAWPDIHPVAEPRTLP